MTLNINDKSDKGKEAENGKGEGKQFNGEINRIKRQNKFLKAKRSKKGQLKIYKKIEEGVKLNKSIKKPKCDKKI